MAQSLGTKTNVFSRTASRSIYPRLHAYGPTTVFLSDRQQCRSFSQSSAPRAKAGMMSAPTIMPKVTPEMSTRSRISKMSPADMPTDFGVLPGTFIRPEAKDMPSLFKEPKDRLRMEWVWLKSWFQNVLGSVYYHKWNIKPSLPLELRQRREIGRNLHRIMYTEFARGNEQLLKEKCAPGLAKDLIRRIRKRNVNEMIFWNIDHYQRNISNFFTGVRVLSDRATTIPGFPDSGIRQIVLRISSRQTTQSKSTLTGPDGLRSPPKIQDCTEYIVIQKVRLAGTQKQWEVWGYTKPTTVEDLQSPYFATDLTFKERVQAMQDMMSAGKK